MARGEGISTHMRAQSECDLDTSDCCLLGCRHEDGSPSTAQPLLVDIDCGQCSDGLLLLLWVLEHYSLSLSSLAGAGSSSGGIMDSGICPSAILRTSLMCGSGSTSSGVMPCFRNISRISAPA